MPDIDSFSLTLALAGLGWGITGVILWAVWCRYRRVLRELAELQKQISQGQEKQPLLVLESLDRIQAIIGWFDQGMRLASEAVTIYRWPTNTPKDNYYYRLANSFAKAYGAWSASKSQMVAFAQQYDPMYPPPTAWKWNTESLPNDLPQLIEIFQDEINDRIKELSDRTHARRSPKLDLFVLHQSGLAAVRRLRRHVVARMKQATD